MKNSKGFTLTEVLAALVLFAVIAGTMVPVYWHFQLEKETVKQERIMIGILYDVAQEYRKEGVKRVSAEYSGYIYEISWRTADEREWHVCISWEAMRHDICLYIPK
ncbi:prepilin-type N-terminal cleavage/methylation domain-containing protein [Alteribacter lacisalsi]|uniref:prepilin-type N-terminal cleavage/methylation domain-containing protein n=1 Tax=Alteribacter lacisalsi TaxID=2045244 RepID=UPI001374F345|nr:prepilin-type N-terminal cleavage/methylation domain-containing protein [Alteribacter lacisalsi]